MPAPLPGGPKRKRLTSSSDLEEEAEPQLGLPWPSRDLLHLLSKIENSTPKEDPLSFSTRLDKIQWQEMSFGGYSGEDCKKIWGLLLKRVRKFRVLREITGDMRKLVENPPKATPPKPKPPKNAYQLFFQEVSEKVKKEDPGVDSREVFRRVGRMYRKLSSEDLERYKRGARVSQEDYERQLGKFYERHPETVPKRKVAAFMQSNPQLAPPRKPKTPFERFLEVEMERNPRASKNEIRGLWRNSSDEGKLFYINWAEEDYEIYKREVKSYIRKYPGHSDDVTGVLNKKEREIRERLRGKPPTPPQSAYMLFTKMLWEQDKTGDLDNNNRMGYIAERWRNTTEEEKEEYKSRLDQMWEEYNRKLDVYIKKLPVEEREKIKVPIKRKKKKEKLQEAVEKIERPKRPPANLFKYFQSVYKGNFDPFLVWNKMNEGQKGVYEEGYELAKRNYVTLYERFLKGLSHEELVRLSGEVSDGSEGG